MKIKINEIFFSLQGEGLQVGVPTIFIRLFGCSLRCSWCDSMYSVEGDDYKELNTNELLNIIEKIECKNICITGGEPLEQKLQLENLTNILLERNYKILLETAGHIKPIEIFKNPNVIISMDCKCPSSNMQKKTNLKYLKALESKDQIKFVINDIVDYEYAKDVVTSNNLRAKIVFQPVFGSDLKDLANLVLRDKLLVRVVPQLHKIIWGDIRGV